ncbi:MAG: family 16 glycosylhydrolase [Planctomycetes bacterium]|nr:family 16 glycosylhydrolase [Planctomycetota bacterium]
MTYLYWYTRITFCLFSFVLCLASSLAAQEMTTAQAQAMRKDAAEAKAAMERVLKSAQSDGARADAAAAVKALDKMIKQFDAYLAKQKAEETKDADPYGGGTKYPAAASVEIKSFDVPVGATEVHVPVTLDHPTPNTVIAHVRVYNGKGGRATPDATKPVIFYPGDPLTKTVSFKVTGMNEGNNLRAVQSSEPDGGKRKGGGILITAKQDAVNEPIAGGREPFAFKPLGTLAFSVTGETIKFDDKGGPSTFSTGMSHGRTQVGNGETGYYGTVDLNGFKRTPEGLVLDSRRLDKPVKVGSPATEYPFLASMLSGHRTTDAQFKHGSVEWEVKMSNRSGSWPALWLVAKSGWPPEIDVYEGFGYNGSWRFPSSLSTNIHGGKNNQRTFTRPAMYMKMSDFGLSSTLDSEFHTFAVTIEAEWITIFVDGKETTRYANPFDGQTWYPLTNVAVKAKVDSPYDKGSGAMTLRSLKIWRVD